LLRSVPSLKTFSTWYFSFCASIRAALYFRCLSYVPSYAAISWKNFVSFSLSRAGTDDGFISGNLLKNDN